MPFPPSRCQATHNTMQPLSFFLYYGVLVIDCVRLLGKHTFICIRLFHVVFPPIRHSVYESDLYSDIMDPDGVSSPYIPRVNGIIFTLQLDPICVSENRASFFQIPNDDGALPS